MDVFHVLFTLREGRFMENLMALDCLDIIMCVFFINSNEYQHLIFHVKETKS